VLPACNSAMMRNIYQNPTHPGRGHQYPSANSINNMSSARYTPMSTSSYHMPTQPFSMANSATNSMAAMTTRQEPDPEDWYNKGFSALRMNTAPHPNLTTAPMLQYQT